MISYKETPFFSIILPTYNVALYIGRCLDSCLRQSFLNFEVLVVDDVGSDNSISIAMEYVKIDDRIKILSNESNKGTYHARRLGVQSAGGKYILFLDPDDEISFDALEKLYEKVIKDPVDIVFFGVEQIPNDGFLSERRSVEVSARNNMELVNKIFLGDAELNYGTAGQLFKREVLSSAIQILEVPESVRLVYAEDALLLFSMVVKSDTCESLTDNLYIYYKNPNAATTSSSIESKIGSIKQIDIVFSYLERNIAKYSYKHVFEAGLKLKIKLAYDRSYLARSLPSDVGYGGYFRNVILMIRYKYRFVDFLRLLVFLSTFGYKRI